MYNEPKFGRHEKIARDFFPQVEMTASTSGILFDKNELHGETTGIWFERRSAEDGQYVRLHVFLNGEWKLIRELRLEHLVMLKCIVSDLIDEWGR